MKKNKEVGILKSNNTSKVLKILKQFKNNPATILKI